MIFHTDFLTWYEPAPDFGELLLSFPFLVEQQFEETVPNSIWVSQCCTLWDASETVPLVASLPSILTQDIHGNQAGRISFYGAGESNTSVVSVEVSLCRQHLL